jgi:hypothetical protein
VVVVLKVPWEVLPIRWLVTLPEVEAVAGHPAEVFGEGFGVAMEAAGTNLGAAAYAVPCCVGLLDFGVIAHVLGQYGEECKHPRSEIRFWCAGEAQTLKVAARDL